MGELDGGGSAADAFLLVFVLTFPMTQTPDIHSNMDMDCNPSLTLHLFAQEPCSLGHNFGCEGADAIWVSHGCRGYFRCGSRQNASDAVLCGLKDVRVKVVCSCLADRAKAHQLDVSWLDRERMAPYRGPRDPMPGVQIGCDDSAATRADGSRRGGGGGGGGSGGSSGSSVGDIREPLSTPLWPVMSGCNFNPIEGAPWTRGLHPSERYGEMIECGGTMYLTTRAQLGAQLANVVEQQPCWATLIRSLDARAHSSSSHITSITQMGGGGGRGVPALSFGRARLLLPPALHMGHNAALVCVNETLHALGGQVQLMGAGTSEKSHFARFPQPGVLHTSRRVDGPWSTPRVALGRSSLLATGCLERRMTTRAGSGGCQMDGKLAAVYWHGEVWLFARANLAHNGGARHVQVSHTADLRGLSSGWSEWEALRFNCVPNATMNDTRSQRMGCGIHKENNIYYMNVQVIEGGKRLLGLMPAVLDGDSYTGTSAGCYVASSTNGIDWTSPRLLFASRAIGPRVEDHPIHLDLSRRDLYVMGPISFADARQGWVHKLIAKKNGTAAPRGRGGAALNKTTTTGSFPMPVSRGVQLLRISIPTHALALLLRTNHSRTAPALPATTSTRWDVVEAEAVEHSCEVYRSELVRKLMLRRCNASHMAPVCRWPQLST